MNTTRLSQAKEVAIQAAQAAGQILLKEFFNKNLHIKIKSQHDLGVQADILAEKKIIKAIKQYYPRHSFLSEEAGQSKNKSNYLWIIDPLDGTVNFSMHNPLFTVSIALTYKNDLQLGVIYFPVLNELFTAEKARGAHLNNQRIKVSRVTKIKRAMITFCSGRDAMGFKKSIKLYQKFKPLSRDLRQLGSAALELAYVAAGRSEAIFIPEINVWDVAAGALLVKEAGGQVTDFNGNPWTLRAKNIIASNGRVHQEVMNKIKNL